MSSFWKSLLKLMGIFLYFSNPYHPQIDGQIKVLNCILRNMSRTQVKPFVKWDIILSKIEFEFNCFKNRSRGFSHFEILTGENPQGPLDLIHLLDIGKLHMKAADWVDHLKAIQLQARANIEHCYDKYKEHADHHKREVTYQVGDLA